VNKLSPQWSRTMHPILLILGFAMIGWLVPEFIGMLSLHQELEIPHSMNIFSAVAFGLIFAGFFLR